MEQHKAAVKTIAAAVRTFHAAKQTFRIFHGSTNSTRPSRHARTVDTSALKHVLRVNVEKRTALVEPNVPMDRLVDVTMRYGLVPPVVMEFPGITVGGGYSGTSGESSSFKHGFFNETLNSVEMVLASGEVVMASPKENADLFYGASGACGTLGVTTMVELQLMEAKKFVKTTYHPVKSVKEAVSLVEKMKEDQSLDYLDGIQFSMDCGAVVTGKLTDSYPSGGEEIKTFTGAWDPWYYVHVQSLVSPGARGSNANAPVTEYIPLFDYLFRYDRGGFWVGRSAFDYFAIARPSWLPSFSTKAPQPPSKHEKMPLIPLVPFTKLARWFLDDFLRTRMLYTALHASRQSDRYVVQDLAVPYPKTEEFINWCEEETGIWPLWLCPLKAPQTHSVSRAEGQLEGTIHPHTPLFSVPPQRSGQGMRHLEPTLNVGLWGTAPGHIHTSFNTSPLRASTNSAESDTAWIRLNRALEKKLQQLGGMKWLYAHTYYTATEFWQTYDRTWYEALRKKWGAEGLPSVYEKVKRLPEAWNERFESFDPAQRGEEAQGWKKRFLDTWPFGGLYGVYKAVRGGEWKKARRSYWVDIDQTTAEEGKKAQ